MCRKNHGSKWIRPEKRKAIYQRDGFSCTYCGQTQREDGIVLTLDHVLAVELGGSNRASNLVTACTQCNSAKGKKSVKGFLHYLAKHYNVNTDLVGKRIRNARRRKLPGYNCHVK